MRTGRRTFVKPQALPSDINVTPLVDVVLVLLIIFMVATPLIHRALNVQLPDVESAPSTPPPETEPSSLVVGITAEGQLTLDDAPLRDEDYVPRLKQRLAERGPGQRGLYFQPDDRAPYARLVTALDGAKAAGAEALGFVTK